MTKKYRKKDTLTAWIFILPFFVLFTVFIIYPIVQGVWVSLNNWTLMGREKFIGLGNYTKMFHDHFFWEALGHTALFVAITTPVVVVLSLILALFANRPVKSKRFLRIAYYIPSVLSVSVASFISKYVFAPYTGLVNGIAKAFGWMSSSNETLWLQTPGLSWFVVICMTTWWTLGFPMLLYLSALQDISPEMIEAAEVDGASRMQILFKIKLPQIKRTIYLNILLQIIACWKVFGQIYMITRGGPSNTTRPIIQYIYQSAFDKNKLGYGAAMSYVLFIIIVICTLIEQHVERKGDVE